MHNYILIKIFMSVPFEGLSYHCVRTPTWNPDRIVAEDFTKVNKASACADRPTFGLAVLVHFGPFVNYSLCKTGL